MQAKLLFLNKKMQNRIEGYTVVHKGKSRGGLLSGYIYGPSSRELSWNMYL